MMTEQFLQQKLAELIYDLGERDFDCIKTEFWNNHINYSQPFTKNQIECFKMFINDFLADLNMQVKSVPIVGMVPEYPNSLKLPPIIDVLNAGKV